MDNLDRLIKEALMYDAHKKRMSAEEDAAFLARIRAAIFGDEDKSNSKND